MPFPVTPILDNANRADSDGDIGANWTIGTTFFNPSLLKGAIIGNQFGPPTADSSFITVYWNPNTSIGPDCEIHMLIPVVPTHDNDNVQLSLRNNGTDDYHVKWTPSSQNLEIIKVLGGATSLASTTLALGDGDGLGFRAIGVGLEAYHYTGGVWIQTPVLIATDENITTAGRLDVFMGNQAGDPWRFDDIGGGTVIKRSMARI